MPLDILNQVDNLVATKHQPRIVAVSLAKRLSKCLTSDHYQVAERALLMFNNDKLKTLLKTDPYKPVIVPIVIEGLMTNAHSHWNP